MHQMRYDQIMSELKGFKSALSRVVALLPTEQVKQSSSSTQVRQNSTPRVQKNPRTDSQKTLFDVFKITSVNSLGHSGRNHCENGTRGYLEIALDPANLMFIKNPEVRAFIDQYSKILKIHLPNVLYYKHEGKEESFDSFQKILSELSRIVQGLDSFVSNAEIYGTDVTESEKIMISKLKDHYRKLGMRFKIEKPGFGSTI